MTDEGSNVPRSSIAYVKVFPGKDRQWYYGPRGHNNERILDDKSRRTGWSFPA